MGRVELSRCFHKLLFTKSNLADNFEHETFTNLEPLGRFFANSDPDPDDPGEAVVLLIPVIPAVNFFR